MYKKDLSKRCPMTQTACMGEECQWWSKQRDDSYSSCAIVRITYLLDQLEYEVVHR